MNNRIRAGWAKWRCTTGVLCDSRIPIKLKKKFYKTTIRPVILYGTICQAVKKQHIHKMRVAEMRMLRWIDKNTRKNRIRNEKIL